MEKKGEIEYEIFTYYFYYYIRGLFLDCGKEILMKKKDNKETILQKLPIFNKFCFCHSCKWIFICDEKYRYCPNCGKLIRCIK